MINTNFNQKLKMYEQKQLRKKNNPGFLTSVIRDIYVMSVAFNRWNDITIACYESADRGDKKVAIEFPLGISDDSHNELIMKKLISKINREELTIVKAGIMQSQTIAGHESAMFVIAWD